MKEFLMIALTVAILYAVYRATHGALAHFAGKELASSGLSWRRDGVIHMEAVVESMEYYARMAVLTSDFGRIPIIVHIPRGDACRAELIFIGERLSHRYPNLTVQLF